MIFIKKFIDKVAATEGRQGKDLVFSMDDAKGLRNELCKLLVDHYETSANTKEKDNTIQVEINGGKW